MTDATIHTLPGDIDFDLDAYEKPEKDRIAPFKAKIGGREITFSNPDEIDWRDLLDITEPVSFLKHCVSSDDRVHIMGLNIPGHKFGKLIETFMSHYKMQDKIDEAQRRQRLGY